MKKYLVLLHLVLFTALLTTGCTNDSNDANENGVDVDLAGLSMTIVQAEYERILSNADDYSGKTIRVNGLFYTLDFGDPGNRVHYIIIVMGDECCQLGFEFRRDGNYKFPGDYPSQNAMILITGTLHKDEEIGPSYLYIAVDEFVVISE